MKNDPSIAVSDPFWTLLAQPVMEALRGRIGRSKGGLLLGSAFLAASVAVAWADAVEDLQGAWVWEDTECTRIFEQIGGKIKFKDFTDTSTSQELGFIISGRKVLGPIAGCTISHVEEENDRFSALLSCSDAVEATKVSMTFRIIDATHFERHGQDVFGDFTRNYKKCAF